MQFPMPQVPAIQPVFDAVELLAIIERRIEFLNNVISENMAEQKAVIDTHDDELNAADTVVQPLLERLNAFVASPASEITLGGVKYTHSLESLRQLNLAIGDGCLLGEVDVSSLIYYPAKLGTCEYTLQSISENLDKWIVKTLNELESADDFEGEVGEYTTYAAEPHVNEDDLIRAFNVVGPIQKAIDDAKGHLELLSKYPANNYVLSEETANTYFGISEEELLATIKENLAETADA